jgi:hypothetical protein
MRTEAEFTCVEPFNTSVPTVRIVSITEGKLPEVMIVPVVSGMVRWLSPVGSSVVCVCVCVCVYIHIYIYVCMYVWMDGCT